MSHHYILLDRVSFAYHNAQQAVRNVSLHISHSEKVALMGANGAGKSTLLNMIAGLEEPTSGRIVIGDIPLCRKTLPLVRRSVGIVFQNSDDQLFMPTVEDDVAFGPRNMLLPNEEVERRVAAALQMVGAAELLHKQPQNLSGGEKKCVAIAGVIAMEPSILLLDEPTASLDGRAKRLLTELLLSLKDFTVIISTHDTTLARTLCPRTVVMCDGQVIADGYSDAILADSELLQRSAII